MDQQQCTTPPQTHITEQLRYSDIATHSKTDNYDGVLVNVTSMSSGGCQAPSPEDRLTEQVLVLNRSLSENSHTNYLKFFLALWYT